MGYQTKKPARFAGGINITKKSSISTALSGKRGIRTPGASQLIGFQDRRIRPLCHLSERKGTTFFLFCKIFRKKLKFRTIFCNFAS